MATPVEIAPANERELVIACRLAASPEALFRCWTDRELIVKWFAPRPMTTEVKAMDVRPGGVQQLVLRDPKGAEIHADAVFLEIVPNRKVVVTDAFSAGWAPNERSTVTTEITFEDQGNGETLYIARARHPTTEAAQAHVERGFYDGWGRCSAQLEAVAQGL